MSVIEFVDEDPPIDPLQQPDPWKVLIVDDDLDVHTVTVLALLSQRIEGRAITFMHAYSAAQARAKIEADPSIAVVLLDVVMEAPDAGLALVREIRGQMGRSAMRIILRTGQPGHAPEIETITNYDINDYKSKSQLTRIPLLSSLIVALRSYEQIIQLEQSRRGLTHIATASATLNKQLGLSHFASGVVPQLCELLSMDPEGLICAYSALGSDDVPFVIAAAGQLSGLVHQPISNIPEPTIRDTLKRCLDGKSHIFGQHMCLYFEIQENLGLAAYIRLEKLLMRVEHDLLQVFSANMAVGFDNALLYEKLKKLAYTDPLLHLPNRNQFISLLDSMVHAADMVLALVSIDDFSGVNSVLGHQYADKLLLAIAERLKKTFDHGCMLARVSADTFGILGSEVLVTTDSTAALFASPFWVDNEAVRISCTGGLVVLRDTSNTGADLLKDAGIALRQAKRFHRGKVIVFSPHFDLDAREHLLLLNHLREAFSTQSLFVVYQPQLELRSGRVVGAEALVRWKNHANDYIEPQRFIPLAEKSGLIVPLGNWVLRQACQQLRKITQMGYPSFRMAVNVSYAQFREPDFISNLQETMQSCGVDPSNIEVELTESIAIADMDFVRETIEELHQLGVTIALDDFGTGYSSLSVVQQLKIDRLKIDNSFVWELDGLEAADGIAALVCKLGQSLGMTIIAEGIETVQQHRRLQKIGCNEGQGYLFARPMPAEQLQAWLVNPSLALLMASQS